MPELPDIELYLHALRPRIVGQRLQRIRLASPFLVRSVDPPIQAADGKLVTGMRRLGKRVVWELEEEAFLVIHLMIAGRFRWKDAGTRVPGKVGLAAFDFSNGTLLLTEAGSKRRASMHLVRGERALAELDPGGIEVLGSTVTDFASALTAENHTLKRALTDPISSAASATLTLTRFCTPRSCLPCSSQAGSPMIKSPASTQPWLPF